MKAIPITENWSSDENKNNSKVYFKTQEAVVIRSQTLMI
jgi:hypothetical protein